MSAPAASDDEPDQAASKGAPDAGGEARSAGRGGLAIVAAKVWFLLLGLIQNILLPAILGAGAFGDLRNALGMASISYNPIVTGSIQGASRATARASEDEQPAVVRRLFTVHTSMAFVFAGAFLVLAPEVAALIKAPHLAPTLRVLSAVVLCYSLYPALVGVLNGRRQFGKQAVLDMLMAVLRTLGLVVGGTLLLSSDRAPEGAALGFAGGSVLITVVSISLVGIGRGGKGKGKGGTSVREHLAFMGPVVLGQVLLNLLLQADVLLLRRFAAAAAETSGQSVEAASPLVGAYAATQLYCFLPYQLLLAITFILFPMLTVAHRDGDKEAMARYTRTGVRLALVLAGLMVSVTSGLSGPLLKLLFKEEFWLATEAMQVLTLGFGAFAIFGIFSAVLNSLKYEVVSMAITGLAVVLVGVLNFVRVPGTDFGPDLLWKTATSTSIGILLATVLAAFAVKKAAGAIVSPWSLLRVLLALGVAVGVGRLLPYGGKVMTLVYAAVVGLVYLVVLTLTREVGKADLVSLRAIVVRKK